MSGSLTRKQRRQQEQKQRKTLRKIEQLASRNIHGIADNHGVIHLDSENLGLPKLSDIISEFTEPLCSEEGIEDMYDLVCFCWNIGIYPEDISDLFWELIVEPAVELLYIDHEGLLRKRLKSFIRIRRIEHGNDPRFITGFCFETSDEDQQMQLEITSQIISPDKFLLRLLGNAPGAMQKIHNAS